MKYEVLIGIVLSRDETFIYADGVVGKDEDRRRRDADLQTDFMTLLLSTYLASVN